MDGVTVSGNTTSGYGGGIGTSSDGNFVNHLHLNDCSITDNSCGEYGGGIGFYNGGNAGTDTIAISGDVTISGNTCSDDDNPDSDLDLSGAVILGIDGDITGGTVGIVMDGTGEFREDTTYTIPENFFFSDNAHYAVSGNELVDAAYTVSFAAGGGNGSMNPIGVVENASYTLPVCRFTAPEGKTFAGWEYNGTTYPAGTSYTVTESVTFTAQWAVAYTVSFDPGEGSGTMDNVTVTAGEYTLPACTFTAPSGKGFAGWEYNGATYAVGDTCTVNSDVTFTATWATAYAILTSAVNGASANYLVFIRDTTAPGDTVTRDGVTYTVNEVYTGFETATYTDTSTPWYGERSSVTSVVFADTIKPISTAYWFYGFSNTTAMDLSKLDTSNVTDMGSMFSGCSGLTSLDLRRFNTANVTRMSNMFDGCSGLTSLNLSSFDTANVTNMNQMINSCYSLTSLTVPANFTTTSGSSLALFPTKSWLRTQDSWYLGNTRKVPADYASVAEYVRPATLVVTYNPGNGQGTAISYGTYSGDPNADAVRTVKSAAALGFSAPTDHTDYVFKGWASASDGAVDSSYAVGNTISANDVTLYAVWSAPGYAVTLNDPVHGSYTATVNNVEISSGGLVEEGKTVTINATPASGYELQSITVTTTADETDIPVTTDGTFTMPAEAVTVSVNFYRRFSVTVPATLPITVKADGSTETATNAAIVNNSSDAVKVTDVTIITSDGWSQANSNDFSATPVGTKSFYISITDNSESKAAVTNQTINAANRLTLAYEAGVPAQSEALSEQTIATVVFTVAWAEEKA